MSQYFIKRGEKIHGPFSTKQVKSGLESGKLKDADLISESKEGPWQTVTEQFQEPAPVAEVISEDLPESGDNIFDSFEIPNDIQTFKYTPHQMVQPPSQETNEIEVQQEKQSRPIAMLIGGVAAATVGLILVTILFVVFFKFVGGTSGGRDLVALPSGLTENEFAKQFAGVYHDKRLIGEERPDGSQKSRNVKQYYIYKPDSSDQGVFYDVNNGEMTYSGTWNIDFFYERPRGSGYYEFKLLRFGNVPGAMAMAGMLENNDHINVAVAGKDGFESSDLYTIGPYTARKVAEIDSKKLGQLESGRIDAAELADAEIGGVSSQKVGDGIRRWSDGRPVDKDSYTILPDGSSISKQSPFTSGDAKMDSTKLSPMEEPSSMGTAPSAGGDSTASGEAKMDP